MKDEFELKLQEDYTFMKQNRVDGERNSYKRWGCECSNGWYSLIHNLCQEITEKYAEYKLPIDIVVLQIKEKFATLRLTAIVRGLSFSTDEFPQNTKHSSRRWKIKCSGIPTKRNIIRIGMLSTSISTKVSQEHKRRKDRLSSE